MRASANTPVSRLGAFVARFPKRARLPHIDEWVDTHIIGFEACLAFTARSGPHGR